MPPGKATAVGEGNLPFVEVFVSKSPQGICFAAPRRNEKGGEIVLEFFPQDAPRHVENFVKLVGQKFYDGQRVHRVVPGFVVQYGDPQTRDMTKRDWWGRGFESGSGKMIGVAEISPKRTHKLGAVALAYDGRLGPTNADSQIYICVNGPARYEELVQGKYAVIGQVIKGMEVVRVGPDGKIVLNTLYYDNLAVAEQLGLVPEA